jgi:hypothetical protein
LATLAGTETLTNKSLSDSTTYFIDDVDGTKRMQFQLSGITASTTRTLTVPNVSGTIVTTGDTGSVTDAMLAGSISNSKLTNNSITINGSVVSLGGSVSVSAIATAALTIGTGLSGSSYNGSSAVTIAIDSTVTTLTGTQTLTNKSLTSPTITGTGSIAAGSVTIDSLLLQDAATLTTTTTTANQVVAQLAIATYRSVEFLVSVTSSTNYHLTKILAVHDGTTVYMTQYGEIYSSAGLATFDMDISGGNIRLLTTPAQATSTVFNVAIRAVAV